MVFTAPSWTAKLQDEIPDSISLYDFMLTEKYGRVPFDKSYNPLTCGVTGQTYTFPQVKERVDSLAKGLAKEFGWAPNEGTEWDKVIGVFSANTIDVVPLAWAVHRLGGLSSPANAQYSVDEIVHQIKDSKAKALFTCLPLLENAIKAAEQAGLPRNRIYILEMHPALTGGITNTEFKTVGQLIEQGRSQPELEPLRWAPGEGKRRCAFLCYSSGTSGLPKGVMISHYNVLANTLQVNANESAERAKRAQEAGVEHHIEQTLGLLPFSHIYALVVINHATIYRGDSVIVLPKFDFQLLLSAIQKFKIESMCLVPPIIILLAKNKDVTDKYDLSSIRYIHSGAAPLGRETAELLQKNHPEWKIRQGYGLTETSTVVSSTPTHDIWFGSSGSLIPGTKGRLVDPISGAEITNYDTPGELLVNSPSVVLGYLNNDKANAETFITDENGERWLKTGDECVFRKAPSGHEHLFIVDRIKELIKVKGLQVAPAELEAHLLTHHAVADCAVIPVPDEKAGEVPKAFVVKSNSVGLEESDAMLRREISKHVEKSKSRHKWLKGGVEFVDVIPKSPAGKILRRILRDADREKRRQQGAKL